LLTNSDKFSGGVGGVTGSKLLHFGAHLDRDLNPGIFLTNLFHCGKWQLDEFCT